MTISEQIFAYKELKKNGQIMRIGLIDVDGHNYPNLPLMKLSAYHKGQGDIVEWYDGLTAWINPYDRVYMSKVFSFSPDYPYAICAKEVIKGGSGYCISLVDGREVYDKSKEHNLPFEIEHIMPDYSLYGITDTAYGFMSRGCPRGCSFCHVANKEGQKSIKVADLSEFWNGQKNIVLCDPNILACSEWRDMLQQLIDSKAWVDINQGLDIRLMTEEKARLIGKLKIKMLHFAWDRYEDKDKIVPRFEMFKRVTNIDYHKLSVFVLVGDRERKVLPTDLERIYTLRDMGYDPFVMIYGKDTLEAGHELKRLQRWVNAKWVFRTCQRFEEYE